MASAGPATYEHGEQGASHPARRGQPPINSLGVVGVTPWVKADAGFEGIQGL